MTAVPAVPAGAEPATETQTEPTGTETDPVDAGGHAGTVDAADAAEAAGAPPERRPRLAHQPALDGLRGLAVGAVLLFHQQRLDGGFLGVDLFFVLSGFLITSLLVVEHQKRGVVDLGRFWARRARRLLPALLALLLGVSVLLLTLTPEDQRARFRGEAVATLGYVANWHRMTVDISYWDIFEQPSPLDHTWSLAIEEQFYVVWPLVALLGLGATSRLNRTRRRAAGEAEDDDALRSARRRRLGWLALGGAAVSFGLLAWQYSPISTDRAYFGTDSRIGATLLGAALAVFVAGGSRSTRADQAANVRGIAAPAQGPAADPIANGGTQAVALPRIRLQRVEAPQSPLGWGREVVGWLGLAWLGWSVFTVDGLSSWYYQGGLAVFALATLAVIWAVTGAGADGPLARLLSFPPLRGLGLISYGVYLWHWPVDVYLNGDRLHVDRWLLDVTRLVVTFAIAVVSYRWLEQPIRRGALRGRTLWAATVGAVAVTLVAVLVATAGARPTTIQLGLGPVPFEGSDSPYLIYPEEIPPDATRLLAVGDSGVYHLGPVMAEEAEDHGFVVATSAPFQCTIINPEGLIRFPDGEILESGSCQRQRRTVLRDLVREFRPDVVVYYLANVGGIGLVHIDGEWVLDCEATFDDYLATALQQDADLLTAEGARLVLATSPYTVQFDDKNPERTVCRNDTYGRVAASRPGQVTTVDLNAYVLEQQRAGVPMFKDIVHLSTRGSRLVTDWLLPQLELLVAADRSTTTPSVRAEPSISG